MRLTREFTNKINWIFDNILPPILRDSRVFMKIPFFLLFGKKSDCFMEFKEKAIFFNKQEFKKYYEYLADKHIQRETDLSKSSIENIIKNLVGDRVLDIACGRGFLSKKIAIDLKKEVYGIDISLPPSYKESNNPKFYEGNIEHIDFPDKFFNTVICAHTLEHVQDIDKAICELRRVSRDRLIIVVPKQREYKFTFDLHINFFPYEHSLTKIMKNTKGICRTFENDIIYIEDCD